jgi:hypothetical protein
LECGAGAPLAGRGRPLWRPAATVLALTSLLVIGTVAAAYAALSSPSMRTVTRPAAVALGPTGSRPVTPAPPPAPPAVPAPTATPPAARSAPLLPSKPVTPHPPVVTPAPLTRPKISPPVTSTPSITSHPTTSVPLPPPTPSTPVPSPGGSAVVLDPGAASTYNSNGYPDGGFGDPSLAIDADPTTAWTASVPRGQGARLAAGLVLDLNAPQRLSTLTLLTGRPGISVGIYVANGTQPPRAITDSGWRSVSPVRSVGRNTTFKLTTGGKRYRFVLAWVTRAASAAAGADINEISLRH